MGLLLTVMLGLAGCTAHDTTTSSIASVVPATTTSVVLSGQTTTTVKMTTTTGYVVTNTTTPIAAGLRAMWVLASTLEAHDERMAELATAINSTVPNIPQTISDELQAMVTVTMSGLAHLTNEVSIRLEYAQAYRYLQQATNAMWTRVQATLNGIEAIRKAGEISAGYPYFDQGRYARDEFQGAFKQYQQALPLLAW
jgi:hypothetical protein